MNFRIALRRQAGAVLMGCALCSSHQAIADDWTYPTLKQDPPGFPDNPVTTPITFHSVSKASKPWKICVSHPHMADAYHLALNYGYIEEAKRLGLSVTVVAAGGYDKLPVQISQIEDCVAQGAEAVIIVAISTTGLDSVVQELHDKNIPVIDLSNGINSNLVAARIVSSYPDHGYAIGQYLAKEHPKGSAPANVLWLPGAPGAGWSEGTDKGFKRGVADSAVNILATKFGNSNKPDQMKLVEDGLQEFASIDYIVGNAPAIEAATAAVQEAARPGIKLVATYQTPELLRLLEQKKVHAIFSDAAVIQAKMAIDQAVRILENQDYVPHLAPQVELVDQKNLETWNRQEGLPPTDWEPVFNYEPGT